MRVGVRGLLSVGVVALATVCVHAVRLQGPSVQKAAPVPSVTAPAPRAVIDKYCVTCHNQQRKTAGLMLDQMDIEHVADRADVWEKVIRKLRTGEMPPKGMPRPDNAASSGLASYLEHSLDEAAAVSPSPGWVPVHRLNRTEYANAVRDLLALEIDSRTLLPADDRDQEGFDNIAGVLSLSPALMEAYMNAARTISRMAISDSGIVPVFETTSLVRAVDQEDRMSEDLPFESRGGLAIRYHFPLDGEYVVKIRLMRQLYYYLIGMGFPHQLEVRVDGARVKVFTVGGEAKGRPSPETFVGNIISPDSSWETYMHDADAGLEARFQVKAGTRVVGISFLDGHLEDEGVAQPPQTDYDSMLNAHYDGNPSVESVAIGGPYNPGGHGDTATRRKIFVCYPKGGGASGAARGDGAPQAERESGGKGPPDLTDEDSCARNILSTLGRRAFRRPLTDEDLQDLLGFYRAGRKDGDFDNGIQRALERILADPDFLFRIESAPEGVKAAAYPLSDLDLASRLSFFLWSSIPDDELLEVAGRGKLKDPAILTQQVHRMLADPRSKALVENFADEWLKVRELAGVTPDPHLFPEFNENLRSAFRQETELFVESQFREDRSVFELLTANYTFLNEQLARHYGISNVYGSHFRRVTLSDSHRFGVLGQGSVLTVTAYPNRTSPVLRGKWLLDNILGSPPPPPPPDVPALKDNGENGRMLSMRQRMEEHRKNPVCASCHVRMDPLGFALENFDAIGRWRTADSGAAIDASGSLPDGAEFQGIEGLRDLMARHRDEFASTFTRKLLTYAVGRAVEYYDQPAVRKILREAAADNDRWSAIILGIVKSVPFQMRRAES